MPRAPTGHAEARLTTLIWVLCALITAMIGIACLVWAEYDKAWWTGSDWLRQVIRDIGSLFIVAVALASLWELIGKRAFVSEILNKSGMPPALRRAGLVGIADNPVDIDWDALFQTSRHIDVFFVYGSGWRSTHEGHLRAFLSRPHALLRIVLPDPEDKALMAFLSRRFRKDKKELVEDIGKAQAFFTRKADDPEASEAEVQIWFTSADPVVSFYRFDDRVVIALYPHKEKIDLPHLIAERGGMLFGYAQGQLDILTNASEAVSRRVR